MRLLNAALIALAALLSIGIASPAAAQTIPCTYTLQNGNVVNCTGVNEQHRSQYYLETTIPLVASGEFTGVTRDAGVSPSEWNTFSCYFYSPQAGTTARIQSSDDNVTFASSAFQAYTANATLVVTTRIFSRYNRCSFTNSTTAQTVFTVRSAFGVQ